MFNFQRILNRRSDQNRSPSRSESIISRTSDEALENISGSAEGFLCPSCFLAFPTADTLQNHYESNHSEGINELGEVRDVFNCPACKMKLGSEIELQSHYSRHHSGQKEEFEIETMHMQVKALEEGKALIQNELLAVRFQVAEFQKENSKYKDERDSLELKAAKLAGELADLKADYDELNTKKVTVESCSKSHEEKIRKLEIEIQQRPEADDVNLLQQEIVSVQKMMDQLTLQREAEKETLQKQCNTLQETCLTLQAEKADIEKQLQISPKEEEIQSLQDKVSAMSLSISKLQQEVELKESEKNELQQSLEKYANYDDLKAQLREKDSLLQDAQRSSQEKEEHVEKLKKELLAEKENVEEMKAGFEKLFSKIEEGEGANTAIVQLQEENARLQEQFSNQQTIYDQSSHETECQLGDLRSSLKKAQKDCQALNEKNKELDNELLIARKQIEAISVQKDTSTKELNLQIHNLTAVESACKARLHNLENELEHTKKSLAEKGQKLENLQKRSKEENEVQLKRITKLESEKKNLEKRFEDLAQTLPVVQSNLMAKENQLAEMEKKLQQSVQQCNLEKESVSRASIEINKLKESNEDLLLKLRNMENTMADSEVSRAMFSETIEELKTELLNSRSKEAELNEAVENMNEVKVQMNEKVLALDEENRNLKCSADGLHAEKNSLSSELETTQNELSLRIEICGSQESRIKELEVLYQKEKETAAEIMDDFESAKELLLNQKLTLKKQMDTLKEENAQKVSEIQDTLKSVENELEIAQQKYSDLNSTFEENKNNFQNKQKEWDKTAAHQIGQIGVLTENVKTLREDLKAELAKRDKLEQKLDDISGTKLELEAKLENALDERRGLLERCLSSETESERLQKSTVDMRRKYDDCVAALQELGRENQTLQVENMKHITRKWADDAEATNCTFCKKLFTVTIRKHHCRNCGNIFCNECSTRTATVASSKKPVRVCEVCYNDITK